MESFLFLKNGDKYLLCNGCVRFFKNMKNKEMAGIKDIEKVRIWASLGKIQH